MIKCNMRAASMCVDVENQEKWRSKLKMQRKKEHLLQYNNVTINTDGAVNLNLY